ncbi:hypothetical protein [Falsiroseomonas sp. E2-1-a20]|uniref:hypothetical protein n=1 Tax=Falsiroseomonas sp. E2-1-a20 TaxID=3239300 RepID=UPI003F2CD695
MKPEDQTPPSGPKLTATQARQGTTRYPVRYILAASLVLVVIGLVVAFLVA